MAEEKDQEQKPKTLKSIGDLTPIIALVIVVLRRNGKQHEQQPQTQQVPYHVQPPTMMIMPPMAWPQVGPPQHAQPMITNVPRREYTIVGED